MTIIVFDLDDTLYEERSFVVSGHKAVAAFLAPLLGEKEETLYEKLQREFNLERKGAFDRVLVQYKKKYRSLAKQCLAVYRSHTPDITLYPEASKWLALLSEYTLYVVTDGNSSVQKRKCQALGLFSKVKKCICTWRYGVERGKPSPFCFQKICRWEKVTPSEVIYIADNPYKDFVGIKPLGFQTVRVLTGQYAHVKLAEQYEAEYTIADLNALGSLSVFVGCSPYANGS